MITVHLQGGLGNQIFQLGFLDYAQKVLGKSIYISDLKSPSTVHSKQQYFETIFKEWKNAYRHLASSYIHEVKDKPLQEWGNQSGNSCYVGYFQNYKYFDSIREEFISKLSFNESIIEKYPTIHTKVFLHIRGGDFLYTPTHNVCSKEYYETAMKHFNSEFIIFTNDVRYSQQLFPEIPIIQESEVDTLFLMSKCSGCICANSSLSWWGAFLDSKRKICIPSRWVNYEYHHETYRVPGWIVI